MLNTILSFEKGKTKETCLNTSGNFYPVDQGLEQNNSLMNYTLTNK